MSLLTRAGHLLVLTLFLFALSCVTVNVYFPAAEVEAAADRIVEKVYAEEPAAPSSTSWLGPLRRMFAVGVAYADIDIDVSTPVIRALLANIEKRHAKLKPFYASGSVGITRVGYLETRALDALALREKATLNKLVRAENTDRKALYQEIVKANALGAEDVADVERIFAAKWRSKAGTGWWIQADDGTWKQKK